MFTPTPVQRFLATVVLASVGACSAPPVDLNTSLERSTEQGRYVVALQPPASAPAINQLHAWQVKLSTPDGRPVSHAQIAVDGGMPQHGHGLPTRPRVTRELGDGTYLIEGMKFSMTGWWEIKLAVQAAPGADKVTFNTVVKNPAKGG
ncbi:MAG TPA: FixH family protein [Burkholderiaceae bacterium]|nr:FixH family protein [Burkholderiaceae bacterium]